MLGADEMGGNLAHCDVIMQKAVRVFDNLAAGSHGAKHVSAVTPAHARKSRMVSRTDPRWQVPQAEQRPPQEGCGRSVGLVRW